MRFDMTEMKFNQEEKELIVIELKKLKEHELFDTSDLIDEFCGQQKELAYEFRKLVLQEMQRRMDELGITFKKMAVA